MKPSNIINFLFFLLASLLSPLLIAGATPTTKIKVDQVGYLPDAPKMAMVVSGTQTNDFTVRRAANDSLVFHGKLSQPVDDNDTGERVQVADFTALKKTGMYYLQVSGVGRSWNFSIGSEVFTHVFYLAMRSYYGQRCGCAVDLGPEFPGYRHAACHLKGAFHPSSGKTGAEASAKGWHDAGDYGRYVVNSGLSTATLLWTFELFGDRVKNVRLNLPESGNGTPDILNEIRWNLDWMLSMQDTDGGVWHKQSSERFAPFVMPEKDDAVSYIIGTGKPPFKNSTATADFAAVMAIAARAFGAYDAAYATKVLSASRQAWAWLEKYPEVRFRNPDGVLTGGYDDRNCSDELLWASAELWRTTGDEVYQRYFLSHYREHLNAIRPIGPSSWASVAPMAMWTYLLGGGNNNQALTAIRATSLKAADEIVARSKSNAYRISLATRDYEWGSNSVAANYSVQLLIANAIQRDSRYTQTAFENLHYLLGRNTFSLSWVTRVGSNPFRHPHHRPSGADTNAEPWPGLLSGGPNQHRQDSAMQRLPNLPPARMYLDEQESYASNEVAINWNAPLVFLLASTLP